MSCHTDEFWLNETDLFVDDNMYMLPYPLSSEWSNRVAISVYAKALHIWIELSVDVKRMYVNNSNCDS